MLRIPVYSLAFGAVGMLIGGVIGGGEMAVVAAGFGCLLGYPLWLKARLEDLKDGKPFHLGSVVNVIVCTVIAVGFGVACIAPRSFGAGTFWVITLGVAGVALWLHWHSARTVKLLPSAREVGREAVGTLFADDIGVAATHAVVDVGKGAINGLRHKER
jgi:hypothetical protein